jgi:hypothetical protein
VRMGIRDDATRQGRPPRREQGDPAQIPRRVVLRLGVHGIPFGRPDPNPM